MKTKLQLAKPVAVFALACIWSVPMFAALKIQSDTKELLAAASDRSKPTEFRLGRYHREPEGLPDFTLNLGTNGAYQISEKFQKEVRILQRGDWKRQGDVVLLTPKTDSKDHPTSFDFSRFYIDDRFPDTLRWGGRGLDYVMFKRVQAGK